MTAKLFAIPSFSPRFLPVWRRNLLVWRKLAIASVLGNIADPLLYMLALGYGIGSLIGNVGGMSYIAFIGTGMVCQSAMFTASVRRHVLGVLAHARAANVGRHHQRADLARRRRDGRVDVGRDEVGDVDHGHPRRDHGARLRPHVARAVGAAARASWSDSCSAAPGS